ncbi:MAG: DUF4240 domain-containing protein [Micrococcales bacterium]|nr:DUF4240 domain-containing protein [Micrococcales bacterium]
MDRSRFYELIDEAREGTDAAAPSADAEDLRDVLERVDDDELAGFAAALGRELSRLDDWRVRGAGHVALGSLGGLGGLGDDGFHYFRLWIIGKGQDAVDQAIEDPDGLAEYLGDEGGSDGEPAGEEFDEDTVHARYPRLAAWAAGTD